MNFFIESWPYRKQAGLQLLAERVPQLAFSGIEAILNNRGGKALGHTLIDLLFRQKIVQPLPWEAVPAQVSESEASSLIARLCERIGGSQQDIIRRSSFSFEDWLSAESGRGSSEREKDLLGAVLRNRRAPQILQQYAHGCGYVVDLGFSKLLQTPVLRAAKGRKYQGGWTNPTWDGDAPSALFEATTGVHLWGAVGAETSFLPAFREIVEACSPLDFGVQLELIRTTTDEWFCVQLRPSPGSLRGASVLDFTPQANFSERILTGYVNRAGVVAGNYQKVELFDPNWAPLSSAGQLTLDDFERSGKLQPTTDYWRPAGMVFDHQFCIHDVRQYLLGAFAYGAKCVITIGPSFTNSHHHLIHDMRGRDRRVRSEVDRQLLLLGLDYESAHKLLALPMTSNGWPRNRSFEALSDGIVGMIRT